MKIWIRSDTFILNIFFQEHRLEDVSNNFPTNEESIYIPPHRRRRSRRYAIPEEIKANSKLRKYWLRRYSLFKRFDEGIKLDEGKSSIIHFDTLNSLPNVNVIHYLVSIPEVLIKKEILNPDWLKLIFSSIFGPHAAFVVQKSAAFIQIWMEKFIFQYCF